MQLHSFINADLLNNDLAHMIAKSLNTAVAQRGHAYLVVSGGKTPIELFKILAQSDISWDNVTITLTDERCVNADDSARNEGMVKEYLLQHKARTARFISLYDDHVNLIDGLNLVEQEISSLPTFDVVILGMGEDGHTASLFPCSHELSKGLDDNAPAVLLIQPKTAPYQRVSLSKKRLLNSRAIFLHLIGPKKWSVLDQALTNSDPMIMPISAFLHNRNPNVQVMYAP